MPFLIQVLIFPCKFYNGQWYASFFRWFFFATLSLISLNFAERSSVVKQTQCVAKRTTEVLTTLHNHFISLAAVDQHLYEKFNEWYVGTLRVFIDHAKTGTRIDAETVAESDDIRMTLYMANQSIRDIVARSPGERDSMVHIVTETLGEFIRTETRGSVEMEVLARAAEEYEATRDHIRMLEPVHQADMYSKHAENIAEVGKTAHNVLRGSPRSEKTADKYALVVTRDQLKTLKHFGIDVVGRVSRVGSSVDLLALRQPLLHIWESFCAYADSGCPRYCGTFGALERGWIEIEKILRLFTIDDPTDVEIMHLPNADRVAPLFWKVLKDLNDESGGLTFEARGPFGKLEVVSLAERQCDCIPCATLDDENVELRHKLGMYESRSRRLGLPRVDAPRPIKGVIYAEEEEQEEQEGSVWNPDWVEKLHSDLRDASQQPTDVPTGRVVRDIRSLTSKRISSIANVGSKFVTLDALLDAVCPSQYQHRDTLYRIRTFATERGLDEEPVVTKGINNRAKQKYFLNEKWSVHAQSVIDFLETEFKDPFDAMMM